MLYSGEIEHVYILITSSSLDFKKLMQTVARSYTFVGLRTLLLCFLGLLLSWFVQGFFSIRNETLLVEWLRNYFSDKWINFTSFAFSLFSQAAHCKSLFKLPGFMSSILRLISILPHRATRMQCVSLSHFSDVMHSLQTLVNVSHVNKSLVCFLLAIRR